MQALRPFGNYFCNSGFVFVFAVFFRISAFILNYFAFIFAIWHLFYISAFYVRFIFAFWLLFINFEFYFLQFGCENKTNIKPEIQNKYKIAKIKAK